MKFTTFTHLKISTCLPVWYNYYMHCYRITENWHDRKHLQTSHILLATCKPSLVELFIKHYLNNILYDSCEHFLTNGLHMGNW